MDNQTEIGSFFKKLQQFQNSKYESNEPYFITYPFLDWNIQIPINEKKYKTLLLSQQKTIHSNQIMQIRVLLQKRGEYDQDNPFMSLI